MNPWDLSSSDLLVWGIVAHLIADWPLQNDWMAQNKMKRHTIRKTSYWWLWDLRAGKTTWWIRHPAAYVHAGIHTAFLALIFGWVAIPLGITHLIIDTRVPIVWWSKKVIKQTQPKNAMMHSEDGGDVLVLVDVGLEVRFWTDQVFHIACVAIAALLITL